MQKASGGDWAAYPAENEPTHVSYAFVGIPVLDMATSGNAAGQPRDHRRIEDAALPTMTSMKPVPSLVHLHSPFINFRDFDFGAGSHHGYRWVDAKHFQLPSEVLDHRDVLAALISHSQFRDTYDGAGVQDWPRHGQWRLDRITPDTYEAVDAETAVDVIHSWANQHGNVPEPLASRLRQEIYTPIRKATSTYLLGQLPADALHDYGPIHIDYHELVVIDRPAATLTLLVAADD